MSVEENKAVVRRGFDELWNRRNLDAAEQFFTPDLVFHTTVQPQPFRGPDGFRQFFNQIETGFPDFQITIEEMIAEGDKVVIRFTFRATNTGEFEGVPPTYRRVTIPFVEIFTIRDGKMASIWHTTNVLDVVQQLGLLPPGGIPRPIAWVMSRWARRGARSARARAGR